MTFSTTEKTKKWIRVPTLPQFRNRISHSTSLKHKPSLLLNTPRMDSAFHRGKRLAITNSHSKSMTQDHSQTFLSFPQSNITKKGKATQLWPLFQLGLHCFIVLMVSKATGRLKTISKNSDISYLSFFWLVYVAGSPYFWRNAGHYSRRHTLHHILHIWTYKSLLQGKNSYSLYADQGAPS